MSPDPFNAPFRQRYARVRAGMPKPAPADITRHPIRVIPSGRPYGPDIPVAFEHTFPPAFGVEIGRRADYGVPRRLSSAAGLAWPMDGPAPPHLWGVTAAIRPYPAAKGGFFCTARQSRIRAQ